jgi:hypothetical protein
LFRRAQLPTDRAVDSAPRFRGVLANQLMSYDSLLIRRVKSPAVRKLFRPHAGYIVVGLGSAADLTLKRYLPCALKLPPSRRRALQRGLGFLKLFTPSGLTYCFVETVQALKPPPVAVSDAQCDTFRNIDVGYGMNEIFGSLSGPSLAGVVPDDVATVTLRFRDRVVRALVTENVFWTRVPRLPPIQSAVGKSPPARVLRRQVLHGLPYRIEWRAPDHHVLRSFTPPPSYVRLLIRRDHGCIVTDCGH